MVAQVEFLDKMIATLCERTEEFGRPFLLSGTNRQGRNQALTRWGGVSSGCVSAKRLLALPNLRLGIEVGLLFNLILGASGASNQENVMLQNGKNRKCWQLTPEGVGDLVEFTSQEISLADAARKYGSA